MPLNRRFVIKFLVIIKLLQYDWWSFNCIWPNSFQIVTFVLNKIKTEKGVLLTWLCIWLLILCKSAQGTCRQVNARETALCKILQHKQPFAHIHYCNERYVIQSSKTTLKLLTVSHNSTNFKKWLSYRTQKYKISSEQTSTTCLTNPWIFYLYKATQLQKILKALSSPLNATTIYVLKTHTEQLFTWQQQYMLVP